MKLKSLSKTKAVRDKQMKHLTRKLYQFVHILKHIYGPKYDGLAWHFDYKHGNPFIEMVFHVKYDADTLITKIEESALNILVPFFKEVFKREHIINNKLNFGFMIVNSNEPTEPF